MTTEQEQELRSALQQCISALDACLLAFSSNSEQVHRTAKKRAEAALARARQWEES